MITGKLNLLQLHAVRKTLKGKDGDVDCLVLPIEKNHLFVGEKGIYLDLIAFEVKNPQDRPLPDGKVIPGDTHLVKQSLPKELREKMTEQEKNEQPILGNLRISDSFTEKEPVSSPEPTSEQDDLPFSFLLPFIPLAGIVSMLC
jgi:hypothetical protein